jgi:hypothetical protein
MGLNLIQVTDHRTGAKLLVNPERIDYVFNMGGQVLLKFNDHDITIEESYEAIHQTLESIASIHVPIELKG